jgi:uncharacterized protein
MNLYRIRRVVRVGLRSTTGNRVSRKTASRVRIPCSPPLGTLAAESNMIRRPYVSITEVSRLGKLFNAYILSYHPEDPALAQFMDCIAGLYNSQEVQGLKEFEQHLEINRLQHITSVSYLSFRMCKKLGLDWQIAAQGGILHDLFYYDWRENDWSHRPHGYLHPAFALKNARALCGELDKKTENIIMRHMWPLTLVPPRCKEAFVVSLADKYCATIELRISLSKKYRARFFKLVESDGQANK